MEAMPHPITHSHTHIRQIETTQTYTTNPPTNPPPYTYTPATQAGAARGRGGFERARAQIGGEVGGGAAGGTTVRVCVDIFFC